MWLYLPPQSLSVKESVFAFYYHYSFITLVLWFRNHLWTFVVNMCSNGLLISNWKFSQVAETSDVVQWLYLLTLLFCMFFHFWGSNALRVKTIIAVLKLTLMFLKLTNPLDRYNFNFNVVSQSLTVIQYSSVQHPNMPNIL